MNKISHHINIPFTVGGGISSVEDVSVLLQNGADKISVNTAAFKNPQLIADLAKNLAASVWCWPLIPNRKPMAIGMYT